MLKQYGFTMEGKTFNQETKDKLSKINKGRKHTEEARKNMSKASKGRKISQEARKNMSKAAIEKFKKEGMKEKYSKVQKIKWETASKEDRENWIKQYIKAPSRHKGLTSIELKVKNQLEKLGVKYKSQMYKYDKKNKRGFIFDFYLPDYKLVIECNGNYWHSLPDLIERDKLKEEFVFRTNHDILWLWENEIKDEWFNIVDYIEI